MSRPDIHCETSKGPIDIVLMPESSPLGVKRFVELVEAGFFHQVPLFRCVQDFLCQFGYKAPTESDRQWSTIQDDPFGPNTPKKFKRGFMSFAGGGKNTRDSHLFITLGEHVSSLGTEPWETPLGYVTAESMEKVVSRWTVKYGDMPPWGKGPDPNKITRSTGTAYLEKNFPDLDYILSCKLVKGDVVVPVSPKLVAGKSRIAFDLAPKLGRVVIELNPDWAPLGYDRLMRMVQAHFLDEARFFRVVPGFVVQFGLPGDPKRAKEFAVIKDDPVKATNKRGTITFATSGPNSRTTQMFINLGDNARLDGMGFSPLGYVVEGMEFVDSINSEYREQPDQGQITQSGNEYLNKNFPRLSYISRAYVVSPDMTAQGDEASDVGAVSHENVAIVPKVRQGNLEFSFAMAMVFMLIACFYVTIRVLFRQNSKGKH